MSISFPRKIILFLIEIGMRVLWVVDKATSFNLKDFLKSVGKALIFSIPVIFIVFLGYSFLTGYLSRVADGVLLSVTYVKSEEVKIYPVLAKSIPMPEISAKSALAMEKNKNRILFEKIPNDSMPPASTVKLMTALVSMDLYDLEDELIVPKICTEVEGTKAWFPENSKFKVGDLISSMLIGSFADSACVLATSKVNEKEFTDLMNEKADKIGMSSTVFSNPIGLDNINGGHHSTASDLYKLSVYALSVPEIKEAVGKKNYVLSAIDKSFVVNIVNTNRLLWEVSGTVGVKTGTTGGAGEVLIYEYADDLKDIVIVVMGSRDRFSDTKNILNWINESYSWE